MNRVISLLTDFGVRDEYAGVMKGVILSHCATARIVDLSHAIPPQNTVLAARTLMASYPYFPKASIHLVVVDPGVGTDRSILLVQAADHLFIAPDNGVLTPILASESLQHCFSVELSKYKMVSHTFHGRDLMAPLAGKLAAGMKIEKAGHDIIPGDCVHIDLPTVSVTNDTLIGEVVAIDHFGNIATSISAKDLTRFDDTITIHLAGVDINGLSTTYATTSKGELLALIDSRGYLEIAVNCGDAASALGCSIGEQLTVAGGF